MGDNFLGFYQCKHMMEKSHLGFQELVIRIMLNWCNDQ